MLYKDFFNIHAKNLYDLWLSQTPLKEGNIVERRIVYELEDPYEEKTYRLVDRGDRIVSFRNFMFFAYENTIP